MYLLQWLLGAIVGLSSLLNITAYTPLPNSSYDGISIFKGCWADAPILRDLADHFVSDSFMTLNRCFKICSDRDYLYAGLQNQTECRCGNDFGKYYVLTPDKCACSCAGDSNNFCGCDLKQRVFQLSNIEANTTLYTGNLKSMGCYEDRENDRDMDGASKIFPAMTPDKCYHYCDSLGFKYAGLQAGEYCFCDNDFGKYNSLAKNECECQCKGDEDKFCGCFLTNRVMELTVREMYTEPSCNQFKTCTCWGNPHCHTFDRVPFSIMNNCEYDLVSTFCYDKSLPSNLVPFTIRQGQEKTPNFPSGSSLEFLEVRALGNEYKFLKSTATKKYVFTINGLPNFQPYRDQERNITINALYSELIFEADFGLKITWDGTNKRVQVDLCDAYAGYTCGLCGNADGEPMPINEFVDKTNLPVSISGGIWNYYNEWGKKWISNVPGEEKCDTNYVAPDCPNIDTFTEENGVCALMNDLYGPWAECIYTIDFELMGSYVTGCAMDMCTAQGNSTEQSRLVCEAYNAFDSACKESDPEWNINWRSATNCELECPSDQIYGRKRECPKTCQDPNGTGCTGSKWVQGCFCKDGLVMNADGKCISFNDCGCPMPDSDTIIPVGGVIISADCSTKYTCQEVGGQLVSQNYSRACSPQATCSLDANDSPSCECKYGFSGDGYTCIADNYNCDAEYCYGWFHHFKSEFGKLFEVNNKCSYILATDSMAFVDPTFTVIVDQEQRHDENWTNLKSIRVKIDSHEYTIKKDFRVNGATVDLPYNGPTFKAYREGIYIVFEETRFRVAFDGTKNLLKYQTCAPVNFGLCHLLNDHAQSYPFENFLSEDAFCDV